MSVLIWLVLAEFHTGGDCSSLNCQGLSAGPFLREPTASPNLVLLANLIFLCVHKVIYEDVEECKGKDGALQNPTSDQAAA